MRSAATDLPAIDDVKCEHADSFCECDEQQRDDRLNEKGKGKEKREERILQQDLCEGR